MTTFDWHDQQFVLRVLDPALADRLRRWLREEVNLQDKVAINFDEPSAPRHGVMLVEGVSYPVSLQDLPTVVESYKTYDDIALVKSGDVGQVLVVHPKGWQRSAQQAPPLPSEYPLPRSGLTPAGTCLAAEVKDGVTPPMRNARQRHFRDFGPIDPEEVSRVEQALLAILNGAAPQGVVYEDVEEVYEIDAATGRPGWRPVGTSSRR